MCEVLILKHCCLTAICEQILPYTVLVGQWTKFNLLGDFVMTVSETKFNQNPFSKLDWSVCVCLIQIYNGRDMYRIYYIKNNYMFWPFTLAIFRLRNKKT